MSSDMTGMVQTVLGPIDPSEMGVTLTHEHILIDLTCYYVQPEEASLRYYHDRPFTIDLLGRASTIWYLNTDNGQLFDEADATSAIRQFMLAGGGTVVHLLPESGAGLRSEPLRNRLDEGAREERQRRGVAADARRHRIDRLPVQHGGQQIRHRGRLGGQTRRDRFQNLRCGRRDGTHETREIALAKPIRKALQSQARGVSVARGHRLQPAGPPRPGMDPFLEGQDVGIERQQRRRVRVVRAQAFRALPATRPDGITRHVLGPPSLPMPAPGRASATARRASCQYPQPLHVRCGQ